MHLFCRFLTVASVVIFGCSLGCSGASGDGDSPEPSESTLRVFLTESPYDIGGGIAGADAHCMSDAAYPGDGNFKALIGGESRSVCPTADCEGGASPQDWVLASNTTYERLDGTTLFTTGEMPIFTDWPMDDALTEAGTNQASALNADWTVREDLHCEDWTVSSEAEAGVGWTADVTSGFLQGGELTCSALPLVCVEQL